MRHRHNDGIWHGINICQSLLEGLRSPGCALQIDQCAASRASWLCGSHRGARPGACRYGAESRAGGLAEGIYYQVCASLAQHDSLLLATC